MSQQILSALKAAGFGPLYYRPFRVPGFPGMTAIVVVGSVAFLVGALILDWGNSWKSVVLPALSWPLYRLTARGRAPNGKSVSTLA